MSAKGSAAARPATASWNAPSMSSSDSASTIVPPCTSGSKPGLAVNSGSRSTATFTFTVPLRERQLSMRSTKSVGSWARSMCSQERDLRMRRRDHDVGAQFLARFERHAAHATVVHVDAGDGRVGAHRGAVGDRGVAQRAAHPAHTALRESPRAELAVADVTDLVVRHHVRGAGRARTGPRADHAAHREHTLHLRRREELVEQVGDAHREQARHVGGAVDAETAELPRELQLVDEVARAARSDPRRDRRQQRTEHVGEAAEPRVPTVVRVGVGLSRTARSARARAAGSSSGSCNARPSRYGTK